MCSDSTHIRNKIMLVEWKNKQNWIRDIHSHALHFTVKRFQRHYSLWPFDLSCLWTWHNSEVDPGSRWLRDQRKRLSFPQKFTWSAKENRKAHLYWLPKYGPTFSSQNTPSRWFDKNIHANPCLIIPHCQCVCKFMVWMNIISKSSFLGDTLFLLLSTKFLGCSDLRAYTNKFPNQFFQNMSF